MTIADTDDLLIEILLWLPAKSLIRFKLVCKRWFTLISSHHFSCRHTLHQRHQHRRSKLESHLLLRLAETSDHFYLQSGFYGEKLVQYYFSPTLIVPTIRSFSNGLFLLQCHNVENLLEACHIYNPTTKQSRKILLDINETYRCVMGLNLAFDPLKSPHYKIICVRAAKTRSSILWRSWWRRCQIEVYESNTSSWKLCGEPFLAPRTLLFDHGIYWKGGIHWRGIFLDLQDSVVRNHPEVVVPGDTGTHDFHDYYIESNGCLHNIAHFPEQNSVMVFELQTDYSQWSLKYRINLDGAFGPLSLLSIIRGENEEDSMLVLHEPGKVMAYKLQENCVKELIDFRAEAFYQERCVQFASSRTFQFVETLAPV